MAGKDEAAGRVEIFTRGVYPRLLRPYPGKSKKRLVWPTPPGVWAAILIDYLCEARLLSSQGQILFAVGGLRVRGRQQPVLLIALFSFYE